MQESARGGEGGAAEAAAVVVTGASSGIGAAVAADLAKAGFQVFGTVRNEEDGTVLARTGVVPVVADVTDWKSIERARDEVLRRSAGRPLAGLVNNAGVAAAGPWELFPMDELRRVFDVNVLGVAAVTQAFLPRIRASAGRIVNISSLSGRIAAPLVGPYAASKFALEALSDSLRRELIPFGVRVICIQPGNIKTPIWGKARAALAAGRQQLAESVYGPILPRAETQIDEAERNALAVARVAAQVRRALTARRPPPRSLVARGALAYRLLSLFPDRVLDRLLALRIPRGRS